MSQQAYQVLYARYNSMRRPDFRTVTEICEDENGLFVRKRAGGEAVRAHLDTIAHNRESLRDYYRSIQVINCVPGDGELRFPYIHGKTLAEIDAMHLTKEAFVAQINRRLDAVLAVQERYLCPFEATEGFESIFGKVDIGPVDACSPANIDCLLENFIQNDTGLYCIDYEWVFSFPVPVKYIKYRILRFFFQDQAQSLLNGISLEKMLNWFGFSEADSETCWQMEQCFQQYIHGSGWKYAYADRYRKKELSIDAVEQTLETDERLIQQKDAHIDNLERFLTEKDANIDALKGQTDLLKRELIDKEVHVQNLEGLLDETKKQIHDKEVHVQNLEGLLEETERQAHDKDVHIQNIEKLVHDKDVHIQNIEKLVHDKEVHIQNQNARIQQLTLAFETMQAAFFWRITKPARVTLDWIKQTLSRHESVYLFLRMTKDTLRHGYKYAEQRRWAYLDSKRILEDRMWPSEEIMARQRREKFAKRITFSILVPLYNTPSQFLREMIESVQKQTYEKWELCLADGSDAEHAEVEKFCREAARRDRRIKYTKLERNMGISENTNACLKKASGDYVVLFDHDDILHPCALYENMKVICEQDADFIYSDENTFHDNPSDAYCPHYKPDYSPDTLRSYNYICHLTVFKRSLLDEAGGGFRKRFDGSQDYDMVLRLTEKARHIAHIPKVLYYWRGHAGSVASDIGAKSYTVKAARAALAEHLERIGLKGTVQDSSILSTYRIQYAIESEPLISIVIPNMDHIDDLKKCIDSIVEKSTWKRWEIIIVENNSKNEETFAYYKSLEGQPEIRIVKWEGKFNFSAICNFGARQARGEYILLLNNDIQVITPDWLEQMLMFAQRSDVGAVGAMLYYPDDTIQHAGVILGIGGVAGHSHKYYARGDYGYSSRLTIAQNLSAVTAACCLIPRHVWEQIQGLDESFEVAFNDVDMCMRIRKAGYLIVWTPYAELYHFESKSRGLEDTPEKQKRFKGEIDHFQQRWHDELRAGDPYYNPNLTIEHEDFSIR